MELLHGEQMVMVPVATLDKLMSRVDEVANQKATLAITEKALLLSKGGTLRTSDVRKLTGWSDRTMRRRLDDGAIPMVKDGRDYHIDVQKFIDWYILNF